MTILEEQKSVQNYREIGKQFAYEDLDESYLKDVTTEELVQFRIGYEEAKQEINKSSRNDEFEIESESRSVHR